MLLKPASCKFFFSLVYLLIAVQFVSSPCASQMRKLYFDPTNNVDNEIYKISFYSANEGYVGLRDWIGFTTDSGHTFTKKYITISNVDYNGYSVNLTFGFFLLGVKAFDRNTVIAYGHYGLVPSILYSTGASTTWRTRVIYV